MKSQTNYLTILMGSLCSVFLFSLLLGVTNDSVFQTPGIFLLLSMIGLSFGWFVGFFLSMPKRNTKHPDFESEKFIRNTEFDKISSWLVSIIIGASLVQYENIYAFIKTIPISFFPDAPTKIGQAEVDTLRAISMGLLFMFTIIGFVISYYYNTIKLFELFTKASKLETMESQYEVRNQNRKEELKKNEILMSELAKKKQAEKMASAASDNGSTKSSLLSFKKPFGFDTAKSISDAEPYIDDISAAMMKNAIDSPDLSEQILDYAQDENQTATNDQNKNITLDDLNEVYEDFGFEINKFEIGKIATKINNQDLTFDIFSPEEKDYLQTIWNGGKNQYTFHKVLSFDEFKVLSDLEKYDFIEELISTEKPLYSTYKISNSKLQRLMEKQGTGK